ncbi:unnamed protein product [Cutaneotrichosporon oleaginosum]
MLLRTDMRGLGLAGVPEQLEQSESEHIGDHVDEGNGLDISMAIDPHRASLPSPPTPVPEIVEHARWPPSPSHWPTTPVAHWSTPPSTSPTPLTPPPRRRPLSAQLEWMSIREPTPTRPTFSPLALPAELELDGTQLFRRASLPLPPRTPALSRRASTLPRSILPRSPGHRALARLSLPDYEPGKPQPHSTQSTPERQLVSTAAPRSLASPIRIREPAPRPLKFAPPPAASEGLTLASPIHLPPTPRIPTPELTPAPAEPEPEVKPPRRRCPGLPMAEITRLLALLLIPVPLWLFWWQRGKLSASASASSLGSLSTTSLSQSSYREPETWSDSSDDEDEEDEGEATIQAAQLARRRRSTNISLSSLSPASPARRDSLAVPSLGGIPMSREGSWDGSAYSSRGASPSVMAVAKPPMSPPLVRRTEEGLLDW